MDVNCAERFGSDASDGKIPFSVAKPWRWVINLSTGTVSGVEQADLNSDFPRYNEQHTGKKHRFAYYAATNTGQFFEKYLYDRVAKIDADSGHLVTNSLTDELTSPGEGVFVPRKGATAEDDGYLLNLWWNQHTNETELVILHCQDFTGDPLARVKLGQLVPMGFHGNWIDA